jgi:methenyltetrahydrofolate cyclohydrolase
VNPERRFGRLLDALASAQPAPASGSAAAAVVAASAALLEKVALRSELPESRQRAEAIRVRAEALIELDSIAYLAFIAALRSDENVDAARAQTIVVPREIATAAASVFFLARDLEKQCNPNLRPDAAAAAILAQAAEKIAMMLVKVNKAGRQRVSSPASRSRPSRWSRS